MIGLGLGFLRSKTTESEGGKTARANTEGLLVVVEVCN